MNINKSILFLSIFSLFVCFCASPASAQKKRKHHHKTKSVNKDIIVEDPDVPPMFTGGTAMMHKFILSTLKYPPEAAEKNIQGLVVHTFVIEKDGTLSNFVCIHHTDSLLDAEALRILKSMPPWRPGKLNGENVRTKSYVPMYFRLNKAAQMASRKTCPPKNPIAKTDSSVYNNNEIFTIVDKMPHFPGGNEKLSEFLADKIVYPRQPRQEGIEERIICSFVVDKNGNISNIEVIEGGNQALKDEAVRVLSLMPNWIPGINKGNKVNVKCLLPIDFKIKETPITPVPIKG